MLFAHVAVKLVQLVIAILFAVVGKITHSIDEEKELARGNIAVGIVVAAVFFAIAVIVECGVSGLFVGIHKALQVRILTMDGLIFVAAAVVQHGLLNEVPGNDPRQAELWVALK